MTKAELLTTMRAERGTWEQLIAQIDPRRMSEPAIHGWSVKDLVGHIAYYEGWLLEWLEAAVRGRVTLARHLDTLSVDERNAIVWERNRSRPLDEILEEAKLRFERLFQLVQIVPEPDLLAAGPYDRYILPFWEESWPLWRCIAGDSFEHYRQHLPDLRNWLEQTQRSIYEPAREPIAKS